MTDKLQTTNSEYRVLDAGAGRIVKKAFPDDAQISQHKGAGTAFFELMKHANSGGEGKAQQTKMQKMIFFEAMRRDEVTVKEAFEGFWQAYKSKYIGSGSIEYRHMWEHIEKMRGEDRIFSYEQVLERVHKYKHSMDDYKMLRSGRWKYEPEN